MRCFFDFSYSGFSNTYLIGKSDGGDAILVDPGEMTLNLLNLIEDNDYYIRHILVTHSHRPHINGINTLLKIYDSTIYSGLDSLMGYPSITVKPGDTLDLSGISAEVMEFSGHSDDSLVYKIDRMLFTGDTLSAGNLGHDEDLESMTRLRKSVKSIIKTLDDNIAVFPGHGPPSTIRIEKEFNPELY